MCGRFAQYWPPDLWEAHWPVLWHVKHFEPRYNVAPATLVLAFTSAGGKEQAELLAWGMGPQARRRINARWETLWALPKDKGGHVPFIGAVIPMNGFYEWHRLSHQPYYVTTSSSQPLWALAVMDAERRLAVVTRDAPGELGAIHPRMPVFVPQRLAQEWMHAPGPRVRALIEADSARAPDALTWWPVSSRVNNPRAEGPALIQRQTAPVQGVFEW